MSDLVLFDTNTDVVPSHLQGLGLGVGSALMAAIGDSLNRIGVKGCRFRQIINGQEQGVFDENYLDVIIVGVVPTLSRIYYAGKYKQAGDNAPPACFSVDNVAPPMDLPSRQSDACATCAQNIKGSKISDDGYETKACGYFRRMVVMLAGDPTLYRIDVKAQGLFGEDHEKSNKFSMNSYAKFLQARGVDASVLVTRLSFDTDVSTPKLLFQPFRYVTPEEIAMVQDVGVSNELKEYLKINFKTIDLSKESALPDEDVPAPATAQARPAVAVQRPVAQAARPVVTPTARPAVTPVAKPAPVATAQARPAVTPAQRPVVAQAKAVPVQIDTGVPEPAVEEVGSAQDLASLIDRLGL